MSAEKTIWVNREPVLIPSDARHVHVAGIAGSGYAVVAIPTWRAVIVAPGGTIEAPDDDTNRRLIRDHFPDLTADSPKKIPT
jgi:hypothetical protein